MAASDHLLRTLASVAPSTRIVVVQCGDASTVIALIQLGFDVWACDDDPSVVSESRARLAEELDSKTDDLRVVSSKPDALGYPDDYADWVALILPHGGEVETLSESARVLVPGGWVWVESTLLSSKELNEAAGEAGLALAEKPHHSEERESTIAIYRKAAGAIG